MSESPSARIGVITFPGTLDDVDAARAVRLAGAEPVSLWHKDADLHGVDAVVVPGGFGVRGIEGKLGALRWAREHRVPTLGLCLGLQCMVIEAARNLLALAAASSTEMEPETPDPVVAAMDSQRQFVTGGGDLGGTMRLGACPAVLTPGSIVAEAYGATEVSERHRHRFEVNNAYRERLASVGLHVTGTSSSSSSSTASCTPTTWAPRPTPSSSPGRPGPTRSSPA